MPRAKLKPTDEQRRRVKSLAGLRTKPKDIARLFQVSEKTLRKYYGEEIFRGTLEADARVGQSLFEMAVSGEKPAATIFWLKSCSGWNEKQSEDVQPAAIPDFVVALEKKAA